MEIVKFTLRDGADDHIQLIQLLKATNLVASGAEAQMVVMQGLVVRNGEVETRKRAKIVSGDVVELFGYRVEVE